MSTVRWPKTKWGKDVVNFKEQHCLSIKDIANAAGVSLPVLRQVMIGKTPGYEITEKVNNFMAKYDAMLTPEPRIAPIKEVNA